MMIRVFKHYIPKSLLVLGFIEAAIFIIAIFLAVKLRFIDQNLGVPELTYPKIVVFSLVMLVSMAAMGLYRRDMRGGARGTILRVSLSFAIGLAGLLIIFYLFPDFFLGRGVMGIAVASAFFGVLVGRGIYLKLVKRDFLQRRLLVIGSGERAARVAEAMNSHIYRRGLTLVGFYPVEGGVVCVDHEKIFCLDEENLPNLVEDEGIDELVVAIDDRRNAFPTEALVTCKMSGVEVIDDITFFERQSGKIDTRSLHPSSLIFADGYIHNIFKHVNKRIFDVIVSALLLAITWPIMLLTAIAIKIECGFDKPVLFRQKRVGAYGEVFTMIKFRSMNTDSEKEGPKWAQVDDVRITKVGKFIRAVRIDELPQIYNVFKGCMSFVGPRPEQPEFVEKLVEKVPYYNLRHQLKPGITGWAQVCFPYAASEEETEEKLQYDLYYLKNYSIFLDLTIIFQTIQVILWKAGSR